MNPLISIDGLPGWLAIATPVAVLVAVALSVLLAGERREQKVASIEEAVPETQVSEAHLGHANDTRTAGIADSAASECTLPSGAVQEEPRTAIAKRIAAAECAGDRSRLMHLLLELAATERNAGDAEAAKVSLRKSIMIANETGDAVVHAKVRLELGDIAQSEGDLTTACEHWQMARALFDQAARADEKRDAEVRMQTHGCPTDWVLTDF